VIGDSPHAMETAETFEVVPVADRAEAEQLLRNGDVEAVVVSDDSALGFSLLALSSAPEEVVFGLSVSPNVELLEEPQTSNSLRFLIAFAFGIVFMMAALGSGAMIMQNTVQEKQSRVVEL